MDHISLDSTPFQVMAGPNQMSPVDEDRVHRLWEESEAHGSDEAGMEAHYAAARNAKREGGGADDDEMSAEEEKAAARKWEAVREKKRPSVSDPFNNGNRRLRRASRDLDRLGVQDAGGGPSTGE